MRHHRLQADIIIIITWVAARAAVALVSLLVAEAHSPATHVTGPLSSDPRRRPRAERSETCQGRQGQGVDTQAGSAHAFQGVFSEYLVGVAAKGTLQQGLHWQGCRSHHLLRSFCQRSNSLHPTQPGTHCTCAERTVALVAVARTDTTSREKIAGRMTGRREGSTG